MASSSPRTRSPRPEQTTRPRGTEEAGALPPHLAAAVDRMRTSRLGATTLGVWTRAEALKVITRGEVDHLVANGVWQHVLPGTYADAGSQLDPVQRAVAAVLASGDAVDRSAGAAVRAVACGRTAARVHGLPLIDDEDPSTGAQEITTDDVHTFRLRSGRSLPVAGQLVRHRLTLLDGELFRHPSGLVLTSPLRTAVDCTRLLSHEAAVCLIDAGLRSRLFTVAELRAAVAAREGWPGVRRLTAAVAAADGRAESPSETLARLLLRPALPGLVPQVRVRTTNGRVLARVDLGDEEVRLAVEVDGKRGHAGTKMVAKDRRTEAVGWWTERVTWHELRTEQADVLARISERHRLLEAGLRSGAR